MRGTFKKEFRPLNDSSILRSLAHTSMLEMKWLYVLSLCLASAALGNKLRPVVLWHGMDDWYDSPFMQLMTRAVQDAHPGIQVYSVRLSEYSVDDRRLSWLGILNEQMDQVCEQLKDVPGLEDGFDGVGFSQGGLFMRAYSERCNHPPMKSLLTFGSPHLGIADLPACGTSDLNCEDRTTLFRQNAYSDFAQSHSIASQYFRDADNYDTYLEKSAFLADINNERDVKNNSYKCHLAKLERFVLVMFDEERIVVPKESTWFQEFDRTTGVVTPLEDTTLYQEDWIGLKKLGDKNLIEYITLPGAHLEISLHEMTSISKEYLGYTVADKPGQSVLQ